MTTIEKQPTSALVTFRTSEIATMIGVHPNTIRFYEEQGLLPLVPRTANGYRIFSKRHLLQLWLIRCAFRAEILSGNLRGEAVDIVKIAAEGRMDEAARKTMLYRMHVEEEISRAKEAICLTEQLMAGEGERDDTAAIGRREAAEQIGVSFHVLRDWERNGLIAVPRKGNRRQYGIAQMNRLKIIAVLRNANYSQMAVRRMLQRMDRGDTDLLSALDTPEQGEDIISVADRYITSLTDALSDTEEMLLLLKNMQDREE
ncbi:MerR family transcriptional regulator [Eubacteriales bacterium OttesenSCG-928-M02]|nr:MerR family transcriptional regulator [Eubacteriales bacterium OttesenSCG-928-M02]